MTRTKILLIALAAALVLAAAPAAAQERVALVIGNSSYAVSRLQNPENDARAMGEVLSRCGFATTVKTNLNQREMDDVIENFCNSLGPGKIGLFYFSGHGIQYEGHNFMIPIGEAINNLTDVKYNAVNLNKVLDNMSSRQAYLNILILDACRVDPAGRSFTRGAGDRGLAKMEAPIGTIIAYATAPGTTASDGSGSNSPYVSALVANLATPGLRSEDVFMRVRKAVMKETDGKQTPWENNCITEPFYFVGQGETPQEPQQQPARPETGNVVIGGDTAAQAPPETQRPEPQQQAYAPPEPEPKPEYNPPVENSGGDYLLPSSGRRTITRNDLSGLTKKQLDLARNEIYARHGWIFKRQDLINYFSQKSWYSPRGSQKNRDRINNAIDNELSGVEKKNIEIIQAYEKSR